jgi:hypothetical protein
MLTYRVPPFLHSSEDARCIDTRVFGSYEKEPDEVTYIFGLPHKLQLLFGGEYGFKCNTLLIVEQFLSARCNPPAQLSLQPLQNSNRRSDLAQRRPG